MIGFGVMETTLRAAIIALEAEAKRAGNSELVTDTAIALARVGYRHGKTAMLHAIERCKLHVANREIAMEAFAEGYNAGAGMFPMTEAFRDFWAARLAKRTR